MSDSNQQPAAGVRRPVLWTIGALVVLAVAVADQIVPDKDKNINLSVDVSEKEDSTAAPASADTIPDATSADAIPDATSADAIPDAIPDATSDATSDAPTGKEDAPPASLVLMELVVDFARDPAADLEELRQAMAGERLRLNAELVEDVVTHRTRWINWLDRAFDFFAIFGLLLLTGPLWIYRRHGDRGREMALKSIPYFAVTSAAFVLVMGGVAGLVIAIEKAEIEVAALGTITSSVADATLQYMYTTNDEDFRALVEILRRAREVLETNPFASRDLLGYLWRGYEELQASGLLRAGGSVVRGASSLVELYGPLLAVAALVSTVHIGLPVMRNLVTYPFAAVDGRDPRSLGSFARDQWRVFLRELRAFFWMLLFILTFTAGAVVLTRLLSYPLVVVNLRVILAAHHLVAAGGALPDVAIFLSLTSVAVSLVLVFAFIIAPATVIFSKGYAVVRERLRTRRPFRDFRVFGRQLRGLLLYVTGLTVVVAGVAMGLYTLLWPMATSPVARLWLPAPLFLPVIGLAMWRLRIPKRFWQLARLDPLAATLPEEDEGPTAA